MSQSVDGELAEKTHDNKSVLTVLSNTNLEHEETVEVIETNIKRVFESDVLITESGSQILIDPADNTTDAIETSLVTDEHAQNIQPAKSGQTVVPIEPYYTEDGEKVLYISGNYKYNRAITVQDSHGQQHTLSNSYTSRSEAESQPTIKGTASITTNSDNSYTLTSPKSSLQKLYSDRGTILKSLIYPVPAMFGLLLANNPDLFSATEAFESVLHKFVTLFVIVIAFHLLITGMYILKSLVSRQVKEITVQETSTNNALAVSQNTIQTGSIPVTVSTEISDNTLLFVAQPQDAQSNAPLKWEFEITDQDTFVDETVTQFYLDLGYEHAEQTEFQAYITPQPNDEKTQLADTTNSWYLKPTQ